MTWTAQPKTVFATDIVSWVKPHPSVIGRAPVNSSLQFGPHALYLAAARSSHLHHFSPMITTPEFQMIARLIEPHVDDVTTDFGILSSAGSFKDFVGTYFTGTVAAGIAYLAMVNEGYVWAAHYEALGGGSPGAKTTPDLAFLGPHPGIALMESKGSASTFSKFKQAVRQGYENQVQPHLGHLVGGVLATHGYCIGSWLRTGTPGQVHIHHTAPTSGAIGSQSAEVNPTARSAILRQNFAHVFKLAHSGKLGNDVGTADSEALEPYFVRIHWRDRTWLSSLGEPDWLRHGVSDHEPNEKWFWRQWWPASHPQSRFVFAIDEGVGKAALASFLGDQEDTDQRAGEIAPLKINVLGKRSFGFADYIDGAILPDGLALLDLDRAEPQVELLRWNRGRGQFDMV